jgi:hypothetical protein
VLGKFRLSDASGLTLKLWSKDHVWWPWLRPLKVRNWPSCGNGGTKTHNLTSNSIRP